MVMGIGDEQRLRVKLRRLSCAAKSCAIQNLRDLVYLPYALYRAEI
jgi:hypothetical protein